MEAEPDWEQLETEVFTLAFDDAPLGYEPFGVKVILQADNEESTLASVLLPVVFADKQEAHLFAHSFPAMAAAGDLLAHWLNAGRIRLPEDIDCPRWIPLAVGVVSLSQGQLITDFTE